MGCFSCQVPLFILMKEPHTAGVDTERERERERERGNGIVCHQSCTARQPSAPKKHHQPPQQLVSPLAASTLQLETDCTEHHAAQNLRCDNLYSLLSALIPPPALCSLPVLLLRTRLMSFYYHRTGHRCEEKCLLCCRFFFVFFSLLRCLRKVLNHLEETTLVCESLSLSLCLSVSLLAASHARER